MILKFKEYTNEGFMTRSLDRNKSGNQRLEDSFWTEESMFEVIDYEGYYISPDPEGFFIDIYHKPKKEPILSYKDLDLSGEVFLISPWSECENESKEITPEEKKLVTSAEFKKLVNKTVKEEVPDDYFAIY